MIRTIECLILCHLLQFILLASVLLAYKVDEAFARSQRRQLGICEECGGINEASTCTEKRCPSLKSVSDLD